MVRTSIGASSVPEVGCANDCLSKVETEVQLLLKVVLRFQGSSTV